MTLLSERGESNKTNATDTKNYIECNHMRFVDFSGAHVSKYAFFTAYLVNISKLLSNMYMAEKHESLKYIYHKNCSPA